MQGQAGISCGNDGFHCAVILAGATQSSVAAGQSMRNRDNMDW